MGMALYLYRVSGGGDGSLKSHAMRELVKSAIEASKREKSLKTIFFILTFYN